MWEILIAMLKPPQKIKFIRQKSDDDCGVCVLSMIGNYECEINPPVSALSMKEELERISNREWIPLGKIPWGKTCVILDDEHWLLLYDGIVYDPEVGEVDIPTSPTLVLTIGDSLCREQSQCE